MKTIRTITILFLSAFYLISCKQTDKEPEMNIVFLHHSTGWSIWNGTQPKFVGKVIRRVSPNLANKMNMKAHLPKLFDDYRKVHGKNYNIDELFFPKASPYGWKNYPFDYYNIWVRNAGQQPFMEEPTLELLTSGYQVIIFKHCFPVSNIQKDLDTADINSEVKTLANYKLQYGELRKKLHSFPDTKFILFTGAVQVKANISEDEANRMNTFHQWITEEWDLLGDNIYLWDLYSLQTEGGIYFKEKYAVSPSDSHPNKEFSGRAVRLLFNRIVDVIENKGQKTMLTGEQV